MPLLVVFLASLAGAASGSQTPLTLPPQPLAFEPNRGQTDDQVAYLARGKGYVLFLAPAEAVLSLTPASAKPRVLRMRLVNAKPHARMRADTALPGKRNYYIGSDPKQWHIGIPTYGKVVSRGVYPGIDMIYHGTEGQLEYDFAVAPRADPRAIRLAITGNKLIQLNDQGDLILKVGSAQVIHRTPYAYQTVNGRKARVEAHYVVKGKTVSFALGSYDHSKPLIIDPALIYLSYMGGNGADEARAVATDGSGNIYLGGLTASTDLPGSTNSPVGGNADAFVTKLNSAGIVLFSTYLGSDGSIGPSDPNDNEPSGEKVNAIALSGGKIYVTGGTSSLSSKVFPTTAITYHTCGTSQNAAFVSILNSDGTLNYSTCVGTVSGDEGLGIAADSSGNAYVVGWVNVDGFPTTSPGAIQTTKKTDANHRSSFFLKLDPSVSGAAGLVYSTYLGDDSSGSILCCNTYATSVAVDSNNVAYVGGWTTNVASGGVLPTAFENALAASSTSYNGNKEGFFYKINPDPNGMPTNELLYAAYVGGTGDDTVRAIAVDTYNRVYLAGQTASTGVATSGAYRTTLAGSTDAFISKFSPTTAGGNDYSLTYTTYLGGSGDDVANGIAVDSSSGSSAGRVYVTGQTSSADFPVASTTGLQATHSTLPDAFVTSLNVSGSSPHYSTYLGGTSGDQGLAIAVSQDGNEKVYVVGGTASTDLPVTGNAKQKTIQGSTDAFVAVIGAAADVGVTMTATDPAPALLDTMTYNVTVANHGPDTATGVTLTLTLSSPGTTVPLSVGTLTVDNSNCTIDAQETMTCPLGTLASGAQAKVTLSGDITTAQKLTATATVAAAEKDTETSNNTYGWDVVAGSSSVPVPPVTVQPPGSGSGGGGGGATGPALLLMLLLGWRLAPRRRLT